MWTSPAASMNSGASMDIFTTTQSITLKQIPVNLNALFNGREQGLTLTSEPIDLSALLFKQAIKTKEIV
jgi:hypothetical protein